VSIGPMESQNKNVFDRVVAERAIRLGSSRKQVLRSGHRNPAFLRAVENNRSILNADLAKLGHSRHPLPECLMPYELEEIQRTGSQGLAADRADHARSCVYCSSLLTLVGADSRYVDEFLGRTKAVSGPVIAEEQARKVA
jgi:hypothetical protein